MHFVGNRAIILGDGCKEIQLYYNPSFTALSVFLPIIFEQDGIFQKWAEGPQLQVNIFGGDCRVAAGLTQSDH